ncbi:PBP1A family penicillin-binding protein [Virgibacillus halodenitrificans]|uniref:transglycosylase domain-containing protein n=1 Tax=Virgibacillus halodenitrificans TaxID=1482 RepID=UPI001368F58F|nr:transglycosylase domain-containing protein [Virgibacillus halodenitrificans]MYL45491.1 PBP1A family penicillin-binding protein [Virgibacillus halodenitrificans]
MRKKFKRLKWIFGVLVGSFFAIGCLIGGVYLVSYIMGPPPLSNQQNTVYYSNDGEIIGEESGSESRHWVELKAISPFLIDATLQIEDQHYYEHHGFDYKRIMGAIIKDIKSLSLKEGASTLTQQYARNLYLTHEKTWLRKIKEAFYTVRLEMFYSKDEILEGYLNTIYYGHGAYGIEPASNYYFETAASELTLAQAAMLAGIPKGPTYYSPLNDIERATKRQQHILAVMRNEQVITESEYKEAIEEELTYIAQNENEEVIGAHFQDTVLQEAAEILNLDVEAIRSGGFEIHTTLNRDYQQQLEKQINQTVRSSSEVEVGVLAIEPNTGGILAMSGGRNYAESPYNRTTQAKRMPGSAFKPFLYYAALEKGFTPTTELMSEPTVFHLENGEEYKPSNYNGYYANKPITLAQALALSDNVYAVRTHLFLGVDELVDTARKFGFKSPLPAVPSLALGTAAVSVKEMVAGYAMLANGGYEMSPHTIKKIDNANGKTVFEREETLGKQKLDEKKVSVLNHLMTGMFDSQLDGYMSVTGSTISNRLTRIYAGKSGTTNSDSWMIGYSPSLVTGVWVGYDDNRPMEAVAEKSYAKSIWSQFMETAHKGLPNEAFDMPAGVVGVPVDPSTGQRATAYCDTSRVMYFEKGTEPQIHCTDHVYEENGAKDEEGMLEKLFDLFR